MATLPSSNHHVCYTWPRFLQSFSHASHDHTLSCKFLSCKFLFAVNAHNFTCIIHTHFKYINEQKPFQEAHFTDWDSIVLKITQHFGLKSSSVQYLAAGLK